MSLDADHVVDRRRMRRKLTFWRVFAVVVVIGAVVALAFALVPRAAGFGGGNYIARIRIEGLIQGDLRRVAALDRLARDAAVKAVIIHINSPGGTTAGSQQLYDALRRVKAKKPIVVVVDGLAASGAYIAAMASDHIIAQDTSLVGSIGVLFEYPNFTQLLKTIGVQVESIKSSPLKAAPNGFEPTSPAARAAIQSIIEDSYAWFKNLVRTRRDMTQVELDKVSDGRVFTGHQGLPLKLIDQIGNEQTAIAWLHTVKKIPAGTPVRDYKLEPSFSDLTFLHAAAAAILDSLGLKSLAHNVGSWSSVRAVERLNLDGLLALWHPPAAQ